MSEGTKTRIFFAIHKMAEKIFVFAPTDISAGKWRRIIMFMPCSADVSWSIASITQFYTKTFQDVLIYLGFKMF